MTPRVDATQVTASISTDGASGSSQDGRRTQMLRAALDVLVERGFPDTRIADVAERAEVSPALVIYYFKTKDRLLTEAVRYAEDLWYAEGEKRLARLATAASRLEEIVAMTCLSEEHLSEDSWAIWLDLWATAVRHPEVRSVREEFDENWRELIRRIVREGQAGGEFAEVPVEDFAVTFSALLDGFAIQIALRDPVVTPERAFRISMAMAAALLGFEPSRTARRSTQPTAGARASSKAGTSVASTRSASAGRATLTGDP
jgi:AcrR family transcriptional regulator